MDLHMANKIERRSYKARVIKKKLPFPITKYNQNSHVKITPILSYFVKFGTLTVKFERTL